MTDEITSDPFDLYGKILDEEGVLGDLKVTSSYKLMKALIIYKVKIDTGEVYKTGAKKGLLKTKKEIRYDGVRDLLEWAIQLNYYQILLEQQGFKVKRMYIQAMCRDFNLRIATERGITQAVYIIPINKIINQWLKRYFNHKAKLMREALTRNPLPLVCSVRERWNDRKCLDYCVARENCPYAQKLKNKGVDEYAKTA